MLIELLVVIAIIAILASLLLPAISRAKAQGLNARCKSKALTIISYKRGQAPLVAALLGASEKAPHMPLRCSLAHFCFIVL